MGGNGPVIGLTFDVTGIRAVEIASRGAATVRRAGGVALPAGAVTAGEITNPTAVTEALRDLWRQIGFGGKTVRVGVASQRIAIRSANVPNMPSDELRSSLRYLVSDHLPIHLDDAVFDYQPIGDAADNGAEQSILLVAAHRDIVRSVLNVCTDAGLTVERIDSSPLLLCRAFNSVFEEPAPVSGLPAPQLSVIVEIGADLTNVVVLAGAHALFARTLPAGVGLDRIEIGNDPAKVADRLFPLMEEIRNTLAFAVSQLGRGAVTRALLLAPEGSERLLTDCLQATLGLAVHPIPLAHLAPALGVDGADDLDDGYAAALSIAGLRSAGRHGPHELSLMPQEVSENRARRQQQVLAGAAFAGVVGVLGMATVWHGHSVAVAKDATASAEHQKADLQKKLDQLRPIEALTVQLASRQATVQAATRGEVDFPRLLNALAETMPPHVRLRSLNVSNDTVNIDAEGTSSKVGVDWLDAVGTDPDLSRMWLPKIEFKTPQTGAATPTKAGAPPASSTNQLTTFSIDARLTPDARTIRSDGGQVAK